MKKQFYIILALLFFLVINTLAVEETVNSGVKGYIVLFFRSFIALILSVIFGLYKKEKFFPNKFSYQGIRFFTSGISLLLIFQSFTYLSATSISLIQRMDIPLIIFTGILFKTNNQLPKYILSAISFIIVLVLISFSKRIDEDPIGYVLCLSGVILIAISYHYVKKTVENENNTVLLNTTCLSCLFFCSIMGYYYGFAISFSAIQLFYIAVTGVSMFCMYQLLASLYKRYQPEVAQYPALFSVFLISAGEMLIEHKVFNVLFLTGNLLLLITITAISFYGHKIKSLPH